MSLLNMPRNPDLGRLAARYSDLKLLRFATGIKGPQRCEPFHNRRSCIQGKDSFKDSEGLSDEELERGDQLSKWIRCLQLV